MKTGFYDPIEPKQKKNGDYPFEFKAPPYDERSSCYMKAGDNYGVGHKQPVGHVGNPKEKAKCLPGKAKTLNLYEVR
jgi:hypothetical protein